MLFCFNLNELNVFKSSVTLNVCLSHIYALSYKSLLNTNKKFKKTK